MSENYEYQSEEKQRKLKTLSNLQKWRSKVLKTHFLIVLAVFLVEVINNIILYVTKSQGYNENTILQKLIRYLFITTIINFGSFLLSFFLTKKIKSEKQPYILIILMFITCIDVVFSHYQFSICFAIFAVPTILSMIYEDKHLTNLCLVFTFIGLFAGIISRALDSDYSKDIGPEAAIAIFLNLILWVYVRICIDILVERRVQVENLLLNILPEDVADELEENPDATIAKSFPKVTVLFTDIVGFTKMSSEMQADDIVKVLNGIVTEFDICAKKNGVEKIKTIGDSYMAASGLCENSDNDGAKKIMKYAKEILLIIDKFNKTSPIKIQIRIGINTGPVVAGVIGKSKFIFDIWGDTVNVASRMESSGRPQQIHVSEQTYIELKKNFIFKESLDVDVKGKGLMHTYFI